ncbi:MAG: hypothetical protein ACYDFT_00180 [Thermoplasmata archaeon]
MAPRVTERELALLPDETCRSLARALPTITDPEERRRHLLLILEAVQRAAAGGH